MWCIPPHQNAAFVAAMEDVLDIYSMPYDEARPVVCMDEHPCRIKGCSPDNSACEGFFGRLKNEMFYKRDWKGWTADEFMKEVDSYIHWYNEKRIKMSLGGKSPLEFRKQNIDNLRAT